MKCSELIKALLQITMDTDDTTDSDNAPIVPSWNLSPSPIFVFATTPSWQKQNPKNSQISKKKSNNQRKSFKQTTLATPRKQNTNLIHKANRKTHKS